MTPYEQGYYRTLKLAGLEKQAKTRAQKLMELGAGAAEGVSPTTLRRLESAGFAAPRDPHASKALRRMRQHRNPATGPQMRQTMPSWMQDVRAPMVGPRKSLPQVEIAEQVSPLSEAARYEKMWEAAQAPSPMGGAGTWWR